MGIIEHYESDDDHDYIDSNLDEETQKLIIEVVNAVIDGTTIPTSDDAAKQALIDLTVIGAEGGREAEVADNLAANIAAGNTSDTMLAAALLCTPYNGYPRTLNITGAINSAVTAAAATPAPAEETPTPAPDGTATPDEKEYISFDVAEKYIGTDAVLILAQHGEGGVLTRATMKKITLGENNLID